MSLAGIDSPLYHYIHEVLGLRVAPTMVETVVPQTAGPCMVFCAQPLGNMELALIERMMAAIGVRDYQVAKQLTGGEGVGLILDSDLANSAGLRLLGETARFEGRHLLRSHNVADLLEGSESDVQTRKRQAWAHLQALKRFLAEG